MSFLQSNRSSGFFISVYLSGSDGLAGSGNNFGLYYTRNSGQTWIQSNIISGSFNSVYLVGSKGIAGGANTGSSSNTGLLYTTDRGENWIQSNINSGTFSKVYLSNLLNQFNSFDGIACSNSGAGIYYTTNAGQTWTPSTITTGVNNTTGSGIFVSVSLSGLNNLKGIVGNAENPSKGIYYTEDGGQSWFQSNITFGDFRSVSLSGSNGLAGSGGYSQVNKGIFYTTDSGKNWTQSNYTNSYAYVSLSGLNGIATNYGFNIGLYYTENGGKTWNVSNQNNGIFLHLSLSGSIGVAASHVGSNVNGIYTTSDKGRNWTQSNINSGSFYSLYFDPNSKRAIVGSGSNSGIYYSSGPLYSDINTNTLNQTKNIDQMISRTNQEKKDIETQLFAIEKSGNNQNAEQEYNNNLQRKKLEGELDELKRMKELLEAHKLSLSARNSETSILLSDKNRLLATVNSNIQQKYTKLEDVNNKINTITQDIYTNNLEMKRKENIIKTLKVIIIISVIMVVILMVYFGMEYVEETNPDFFKNFSNKFSSNIYV